MTTLLLTFVETGTLLPAEQMSSPINLYSLTCRGSELQTTKTANLHNLDGEFMT